MEEQKYRYWLKTIRGIGNNKQKKLVEYCGSAKEVYGLKKEQLEMVYGISEKDAERITESKTTWDIDGEWEKLLANQIQFVTMEDEKYPEKLRHFSDAPYAFFYKGKLPKGKTAAIVGARQCSSYGKNMAHAIGKMLSEHNIAVISGMAYGIDSFGHWGAINGGGETYAVLGCGVDVCYPKGAEQLYHKILECGGIISEYLPLTQPAAGLFPMRNRIISALSDIVIVVEAKKRSGSLITADFALEQGKDIYALPGRIDDKLSRGCNELICQGAGMILSVEELGKELGFDTCENVTGKENPKKILEKEELLVYSCFDLHAKTMEELMYETKLQPKQLADVLIRLTWRGLIEEEFKNQYRKKTE